MKLIKTNEKYSEQVHIFCSPLKTIFCTSHNEKYKRIFLPITQTAADKENLLTQNSRRILLNKAKNYFSKCRNLCVGNAYALYIALFVRVDEGSVVSDAAMFNKCRGLSK